MLAEFYVKWFRTHLNLNHFVEIGYSRDDNKSFKRNILRDPLTASELALELRGSMNVMASMARFPKPEISYKEASYPVLSLDFDCREDPVKALYVAREFMRGIKEELGADPVLVKSGLKGAHLHIPLANPLSHEELVAVSRALFKKFNVPSCNNRPILDQQLIVNWRALVRVPYTYNIKEGARRLAVVLDMRLNVVKPKDFEWGAPLNPKELGLAVVEADIPKIVLLGSQEKRYSWIERILENGLPDGRKRFILYIASRYLANIQGLDDENALERLRSFLEASCRNYGNCSKVYETWLRSVLRGVRSKGLKPLSLKALMVRDPELYEVIANEVRAAPNS